MRLMAELRRTGAGIELGEGGSLVIDPIELVPEKLVQLAVKHKKELVTTLQVEVFSGIAYADSALYLALDDLYSYIKKVRDERPETSELCTKALAQILALEDSASLIDMRERIAKERPTLEPLIESIVQMVTQAKEEDVPVRGGALLQLATEIFGVPQSQPKPAAAAPAIDASAFAPAAPKQFTLG